MTKNSVRESVVQLFPELRERRGDTLRAIPFLVILRIRPSLPYKLAGGVKDARDDEILEGAISCGHVSSHSFESLSGNCPSDRSSAPRIADTPQTNRPLPEEDLPGFGTVATAPRVLA